MRWNDLFSDLEGQAAAAQAADFAADVTELTRAERASVDLLAMLKGSRGRAVRAMLRDGSSVSGVLEDASGQWILLHDQPREHVVPLRAVSALRGLADKATHVGDVDRRITLGHALRALSRDRSVVTVHVEGGEFTGVIDAVGADYLQLALLSEGKRAETVSVRFEALTRLTSQ